MSQALCYKSIMIDRLFGKMRNSPHLRSETDDCLAADCGLA